MANFQGSTTALAKEATWTSQTRLRERHDTLAGSVFANKAGKLYIEQSPDGTNWDVSTSYAIAASDGKGFTELLVLPYWRIRYVNGTEAQGTFRISVTTQAGGDS
jgi:hypothetical protein